MPAALVPVDAEHNKSKEFARVFCAVLSHSRDKSRRSWGDCGKYLATVDTPQPLPAIAARYHWLLAPDFGDGCLKDVHAFSTSIAHLTEAHQVAVESFALAPFGSSEKNGASLARHVDEAWAGDKSRPFVIIGYGKGAADILEALRVLEEPKAEVAAIVTIAGLVGGTWVSEDIRTLMQPGQPWIAPDCPGNIQDGLHSLLREVRQGFLRENPPPVPGYSVVAASSFDETSSLFRPSWKRLSVHAKEQDGQIVAWESVLPGAKYLGAARADHWGIGLPFEETERLPKGLDRNHFPRDALLEALLRFVSADLQTKP